MLINYLAENANEIRKLKGTYFLSNRLAATSALCAIEYNIKDTNNYYQLFKERV